MTRDSPWKNSTGWLNTCPDTGNRMKNKMIWQKRDFNTWIFKQR